MAATQSGFLAVGRHNRVLFFAGLLPNVDANQIFKIWLWLTASSVAITFLTLILAMSAYGFVHGLVALDSSVTATPAPIGKIDFATVGWTDKDQLRHSLIYQSPEAISIITNWLDGALERL
jgi:hypothetical protein